MTLLSDAIAKEIPGRAMPLIDSDNKLFYDGCARGELLIQRCLDTKKFQFYPRSVSVFTGGPVEWVKSSGKGSIHTFSVVRRNYPEPHFAALTPYVVAMIDVAEGVRMMSNVTGCALEDVKIGMPVEVYFGCVSEALQVFLPFWRPAS
jgi:uncharacterized OB-fold protein